MKPTPKQYNKDMAYSPTPTSEKYVGNDPIGTACYEFQNAHVHLELESNQFVLVYDSEECKSKVSVFTKQDHAEFSGPCDFGAVAPMRDYYFESSNSVVYIDTVMQELLKRLHDVYKV